MGVTSDSYTPLLNVMAEANLVAEIRALRDDFRAEIRDLRNEIRGPQGEERPAQGRPGPGSTGRVRLQWTRCEGRVPIAMVAAKAAVVAGNVYVGGACSTRRPTTARCFATT